MTADKQELPDEIYIEKNIHGFYDGFSDVQRVPLTKYVRADLCPAKAEDNNGKGDALDDIRLLRDILKTHHYGEKSRAQSYLDNLEAALSTPAPCVDVEQLKRDIIGKLKQSGIKDCDFNWDDCIDHLAASGYLSAPQVSREKDLMAVIVDLHTDALRHKTDEQTWHTIVKHAAIIAQAQAQKE